MTFKKSILFVISALFMISIISFASAAIAFVETSVSTTGSHNSDVAISFTLNNTGTVNYTALNWATSSISSNAVWKTLPSSATLLAGETKQFSAVLTINNNAAGTVTGNIHATSTPAANADLPITVNISVSPSLAIENVQTLTKTQNATIKVTNTGNVVLSNINLSSSGEIASLFSSNNLVLSSGSSTNVNVNALTDLGSFKLGKNNLNILAKDLVTNVTNTFTYTITTDFCDKGNVNATKVDITNIEDKSSDTDNEWEWKPLDNIVIQVEVGNDIGKDKDFSVELSLYDTEDQSFVEIDGENSIQNDLSIDDGDTEKTDFEFQIPSDIEESDGRYAIFVKAYVDGDEDAYCNSYNALDAPDSSVDVIQINKKNNEVIIDEVSPAETVSPGDFVTISARAFNIGNNDEDKVKVTLSNSKLGLNLDSTAFGLDMGDSNLIDFSFVVPDTAENGVYLLRLVSSYSYKKSSDTYSRTSDTYEAKITVVGGKNANTTSTSSGISAELVSGANAGSQMEITTTIKNLGTTQATFSVAVKNYESWASLNSMSSRVITLNAGESKDISIKFDVDKDTTGEQTFTIESQSNGKISSKEVAVEIGGSSFFSGLLNSMGNNSVLWIIGIINVVLILLIIYIAIRLFRR